LALVAILWMACAASRGPSLGTHDGIRVLHTDELGYGYNFEHNSTKWTQWGYRSGTAALQAAKVQRAAFDQAVVEQLERQFRS
jgi:hypothetical protein